MVIEKIDTKIKPLVQALWNLGFETSQSCQGHLNWGMPICWVHLKPQKDIKKLKELIKKYNKTSKVKWCLDSDIEDIIRLRNKYPKSFINEFKKAQKDIKTFVRFLKW